MTERRLLIKGTGLADGMSLASGYKATPLFRSIGAPEGPGMARSPQWMALSRPDDGRSTAWDDCHKLLAQGPGIAGGSISFAEPDLPQKWLFGDERAIGFGLSADCGTVHPQDTRYPTNGDLLWWRQAGFSQLDDAARHAGAPTAAQRVRVAHLDTGYDPQHAALPAHMNFALQRNFVDAGSPNDAQDTAPNLFANPGHGMGTLSLLAGKAFGANVAIGGAPEAEIIPIRVADSVVLFYNSAIAQALDYVHGLCANPATFVDVITLSMGGVASQAWAEAINALYERGVFIVSAAGNNYGNLPSRNVVFPARFHRVVAACGTMADGAAYADLAPDRMAGNYGPSSKMDTAMAGFSPNTGWARKGCNDVIDWNGSGTSAATPQIAAAAANWIQTHRAALAGYSAGWTRVEAIRQALFSTAGVGDAAHLGRGKLRADDALGAAAANATSLQKAPEDRAYFSLLDVLIGSDLGVVEPAARRMLGLEALQLSQSATVEAVLPDDRVDPATLTPRDLSRITEALLAQPGISATLAEALEQHNGATRIPPRAEPPPQTAFAQARLNEAMAPSIDQPTRRRLQVFAVDPSLGTDFATAGINRATLSVRWEELRPGPIGEYLEVVDVDPASRAAYAPVDLEHRFLLPQDGLAPSEANPQFHQQMCYAVAMRTVEHFETALGRRALWARATIGDDRDVYVQRLRIYPHGIRTANAYYSPDKKALLLGYFTASEDNAGSGLPHGVYFAALSHDIIAHETTHALLDGLHTRFSEPTNPDVLAFHEAFADIVALFQHFTLPEALKHEIRKTRGDLEQENLLGKLAVEFGQAMRGGRGALRDAIGTMKDGEWMPAKPEEHSYDPDLEPHALGSVLVSAVFSAFLAIYKARVGDLKKLATNGTGVLPEGEIPVGLADRMAEEASKVAEQVMRMCIRALDYCPPVDITFGDYLRALITADRDLVPDDPRGYRSAFAAAFRDRGIFPPGVRHLSPDNLVWNPPPLPIDSLDEILKGLDLTWTLDGDRKQAFDASRVNARMFHDWISDPAKVSDEVLGGLGLNRAGGKMTIPSFDGQPATVGDLGGIEVHSVRPARRIGPDGQSQTDLVVEITQTLHPPLGGNGQVFRGGSTILIDLKTNKIRYCVTKRLASAARVAGQQNYRLRLNDTLRASYFREAGIGREPFALLHQQRF